MSDGFFTTEAAAVAQAQALKDYWAKKGRDVRFIIAPLHGPRNSIRGYTMRYDWHKTIPRTLPRQPRTAVTNARCRDTNGAFSVQARIERLVRRRLYKMRPEV